MSPRPGTRPRRTAGFATCGRTRRVGRWLVGLTALAVLTVACTPRPTGSPAPTGPGTGDRPSASADPARTGRPGPSVDAPRPSTAGPPGTGTYEADIGTALRTVVAYWQERFAEEGRTFTPVRRVVAYSGTGGPQCGGKRVPARNAVYCGGADFIAYDSVWLRGYWRDIGDTFVYFLVGHEYGHAVQARLGLGSAYSIKNELQADCLAGAYLGGSVRDGRLSLEDGDVEELFRGLAAVADRPQTGWFDPGAHGSALQRRAAFFTGYLASAGACTTEL
ncbi:neutral zinc metallopeptidase [Micromonospora echinofusca]|uniref:Metalloprotease n=1 Tax=Micromonospora echinofusca TaxID=47858 RepID=A0ABS3W059_MICEH|nr:neutral zinc metallopeptidase [Micromonospora echinofusca]MBO4210179.1 hypothetical protein [Micromonospora echinofusca]